jgi:RNA polymerase sigma-70 factor, ECF subfamily
VDLDRLFEQIHPQLFRYLYRLTGDADAADDVAQEAFVRLIRHDLPAEEVRPWLFTVATNLIRDRARKSDRHRRLQPQVPVASALALPDAVAEQGEVVGAVRRALLEVPERDRLMLLMREEGFSYGEIARAVGVAPGSVGTLLARAGRRFASAFTSTQGAREIAHDASG